MSFSVPCCAHRICGGKGQRTHSVPWAGPGPCQCEGALLGHAGRRGAEVAQSNHWTLAVCSLPPWRGYSLQWGERKLTAQTMRRLATTLEPGQSHLKVGMAPSIVQTLHLKAPGYGWTCCLSLGWFLADVLKEHSQLRGVPKPFETHPRNKQKPLSAPQERSSRTSPPHPQQARALNSLNPVINPINPKP